MVRIFQDYRIGAGYNVALNSLVNIETIQPANDRYFVVVNSFGSYDPGVQRIRGDGLGYFAGFASLIWRFAGMTFAQHTYLRNTYCAGGYTGKVTIYTRLDNFSTYARYNAILDVRKLPELRKRVNAFADVDVIFRRLTPAT